MKKLFFLFIGIVFVFGFDLKDAKKYEQECNKGMIGSCELAAEIYGVYLKNYKKAIPLYEKSCKYGNSKACYNVGFLYENGKGVTQNYVKAAQFYKKACESDKGYAYACNNLAILYYSGKGVSKNYYKTYEYFIKAAKKGDSSAQKNLDILCREHPWACK
jgi:TPR repeat protein